MVWRDFEEMGHRGVKYPQPLYIKTRHPNWERLCVALFAEGVLRLFLVIFFLFILVFVSLCSCCLPLCDHSIEFSTRNVDSLFKPRLWHGGLLTLWASGSVPDRLVQYG